MGEEGKRNKQFINSAERTPHCCNRVETRRSGDDLLFRKSNPSNISPPKSLTIILLLIYVVCEQCVFVCSACRRLLFSVDRWRLYMESSSVGGSSHYIIFFAYAWVHPTDNDRYDIMLPIRLRARGDQWFEKPPVGVLWVQNPLRGDFVHFSRWRYIVENGFHHCAEKYTSVVFFFTYISFVRQLAHIMCRYFWKINLNLIKVCFKFLIYVRGGDNIFEIKVPTERIFTLRCVHILIRPICGEFRYYCSIPSVFRNVFISYINYKIYFRIYNLCEEF